MIKNTYLDIAKNDLESQTAPPSEIPRLRFTPAAPSLS